MALDDAARGIYATMRAAAAKSGTPGLLRASECPTRYADEDPRNVWAMQGRFAAPSRTVTLPLAGVHATLQQRWEEQGAGGRASADERATDIEGHSTAAVCWDGSVVLADLMCLPPAVLLAHSPALARSPASYAGWRWADKTVVELGCGISALPSLAAAWAGARRVVCTDGNEEVLRLTRVNAERWAREQPGVVAPVALGLRWGECGEARDSLRALGVGVPVDVLLAADCIYVLDNPGAWGKLLRTIVALAGPRTLIFVTYADRGHDKLWQRFVAQRVEGLFHVVRVGAHLLHPCAQPGAPGRLEQLLPSLEVYCWTLRTGSRSCGRGGRERD